MFWPYYPSAAGFGEDDAAFLQRIGFNAVRVGVIWKGVGFPDWAVQDDGLPTLPKAGFGQDYMVMPALERAFDHFWQNSPGPGGVGLQVRYAAAWRQLAAYFAGNRSVRPLERRREADPQVGGGLG